MIPGCSVPIPARRSRTAAWTGAAALLVACATPHPTGERDGRASGLAAVTGGLSEAGLRRLTSDMDPAMLALARRHDPGLREPDAWGRPEGWARLDMASIPDLGLGRLTAEAAQEVNALRPFARAPIRPMRPFRLGGDGPDARRALTCLTQAVYFEAAREPLSGQEAVAQVVLNRLRHPAYPKSVCGVVFQGSARTTGCQFSFTCDGSMRWAPEPRLWSAAQAVARRALAGFVQKEIGSATHYHADYVAPYWAPSLIKLRQLGAHIFYRWTGPGGEPGAFTGRYAGGEARLSQAVLQGADPRTQNLFAPEAQGLAGGRKVTLSVAGEVRTYTVVDPSAVGGQRTRVLGAITAPRRQPTPEEVRRINESLATMEQLTGEEISPAPGPGAAP